MAITPDDYMVPNYRLSNGHLNALPFKATPEIGYGICVG